MIKPGMYISDRYEIIEKVGSGGMADVYKAKCHRLNRYVAIKILKNEYSNDKNFVTKFRGEAQSAAGLSHPNIVSVYDVGDDNGLHYIVMELVEGITLKKFIERKGKLEIKEAVGIAIQIAQGMEAAHVNHIIHRDIKPQNIIISRDGKVKVADFGIAKAATSQTVTQNAVGSVHYLSPEQARGGYSDEKSDIYSLGVTMYEMLSGQVPFAGDNTVSVALSHIQADAVPVKEINPSVPHSVDLIVQKCMQKKPENRYLSASELIGDLKRSILNPEGDFVRITTGVVPDSPTINMTKDEMEHIKSAAKSPVTHFDAKKQVTSQILKEEEEELDNGPDSKWDKVLVVTSVVVTLIFAITVFVIVAKFIGLFGTEKPTTIPTPTITQAQGTPTLSPTPIIQLKTFKLQSVVGRTKEDAESLLRKQSEEFKIKYKEDYSEEYEAGMVMDQYPKNGADVAENDEIILTISVGAEKIPVPNVYALLATQADAQLSSDFEIKIVYEHSDTIEAERVIRTIPEREEYLAKGSEITLVVSSGRQTVSVPSVIGMTLEGAKQKLTNNGLEIGSISYETSQNYAEGLVTYQSYSSGNSVPKGTKVNVTVSSGAPTPTLAPTSTPTPTPTEALLPTPTPDAGSENGSENGNDTSEEPEKSGFYYVQFTINENPLYEGDSQLVYLEIQQNGVSFKLYEQELMYEDFVNGKTFSFKLPATEHPYTELNEGTATVVMYVDDMLYTDNVWTINVEKSN